MKNFSRRGLLLAGAGAAVLPWSATAQEAYPTHPIRIVIPYGVGGGTDTVFRLFGPSFEKALGGNVIADYAPGAGTLIGTLKALTAPPNGYTLLLTTSAVTLNTVVLENPRYKMEDVEVIAPLVQYPYMLVVNKQVPVNSVAEFIADAKKNPDKYNFVSLGQGSPTLLLTERMMRSLGIKLTAINYGGTGPAQMDFLSNRVQLQLVAASKQYTDAAEQKILAVAGDDRLPLIPNVPTFKELGYPDMVGGTWFGLFAPKGVPAPIIAKLRQAAAVAVKDSNAAFVATGHFPVPGGVEGFPKYVTEDLDRWKADFVKAGGIKSK